MIHLETPLYKKVTDNDRNVTEIHFKCNSASAGQFWKQYEAFFMSYCWKTVFISIHNVLIAIFFKIFDKVKTIQRTMWKNYAMWLHTEALEHICTQGLG